MITPTRFNDWHKCLSFFLNVGFRSGSHRRLQPFCSSQTHRLHKPRKQPLNGACLSFLFSFQTRTRSASAVNRLTTCGCDVIVTNNKQTDLLFSPPNSQLTPAATHFVFLSINTSTWWKWSGTTQVQLKGLVLVVCVFIFSLSLFLKLYRNHGCSTCCLTVKRSPGGAAEFLPPIYWKGKYPRGPQWTSTHTTPVNWNRGTGVFKRVWSRQ